MIQIKCKRSSDIEDSIQITTRYLSVSNIEFLNLYFEQCKSLIEICTILNKPYEQILEQYRNCLNIVRV